MKKKKINNQLRCCFCNAIIEDGFGNNPYPAESIEYACCDYCNSEIVIPARFGRLMEDIRNGTKPTE